MLSQLWEQGQECRKNKKEETETPITTAAAAAASQEQCSCTILVPVPQSSCGRRKSCTDSQAIRRLTHPSHVSRPTMPKVCNKNPNEKPAFSFTHLLPPSDLHSLYNRPPPSHHIIPWEFYKPLFKITRLNPESWQSLIECSMSYPTQRPISKSETTLKYWETIEPRTHWRRSLHGWWLPPTRLKNLPPFTYRYNGTRGKRTGTGMEMGTHSDPKLQTNQKLKPTVEQEHGIFQ